MTSTKIDKRLLGAILISIITTPIFSQFASTKTSYFMDNAPYSSELNPAIRPYRGYLNLGVGNFVTNFSTGNISLDKLVYIKPDGSLDYTISDPIERKKLVGIFGGNNRMHQNFTFQPFGFGFYTNKLFWNFNIGIKQQVEQNIPGTILDLIASGNDPNAGTFDLKNTNLRSTSFGEIALGTSYKIDEKWSIGIKGKYIIGMAFFDASFERFDLTMNGSLWSVLMDGRIRASLSGFQGTPGDTLSFEQLGTGVENSWKKPAGYGYGVDFGVTFKPIKSLTLSAAVIDLGAIYWKKESNTISSFKYDYTFVDGNQNLIDALPDLPKADIINDESSSFKSALPTNINLGCQYSFLNDKLSLGVLSTTRLGLYSTSDLTFSFNMKPMNVFNASISYTSSNLKFNSIGAAISWTPYWFLNMFVATDYIFYKVSPQYIPIYANHLNVQVGITIPLGNGKKNTEVEKMKKKPNITPKPIEKNGIEPFEIR